jgi:hypothetical protein
MPRFSPAAPLRPLSAFALIAAALALPPSANGSPRPPTVEVDAGLQSVVVTGAERLGRGPVRLHLRARRLAAAHTLAVIELKRGLTAGDVRAADVARLDDAGEIEELGRLVAGGDVYEYHDHVTTVTARAREYAVVDLTSEERATASFQVGPEASAARLPRATATLAMRDDGFVAPRSLPRDGVLRIVNQGERRHQTIAWRLNSRTTLHEAVRGLRAGHDPARYGRPTVLTGLVSGHTVNRVEATLRRGRYVLVSFYSALAPGGRSDIQRGLVATTRVR